MKINILLPYKERFDVNFASSVSTTVKNNLKYSRYRKDIRVFGNFVDNPIFPENFVGIKKPSFSLISKNKFLAKKMCQFINADYKNKQLIEIHNRPYLFNYILNKVPQCAICLFFHNNPVDMLGSKSSQDRLYLVKKAKAIFCVSEYIKNQFLIGLPSDIQNVFVLHNGIEKLSKKKSKKKKEIIYVGRLVKEKGVHLYVKASIKIAKLYPEWKFYIIGSSHLGSKSKNTKFVREISAEFNKIGTQAFITGFLNNKEVNYRMKSASIIVVPSLWQEPFGLVVAEAMCHGIAIITSKVGGIPEIINENGIVIEDINEDKIIQALQCLIENRNKLEKLQKLSWDSFNLPAEIISNKLDDFRDILF